MHPRQFESHSKISLIIIKYINNKIISFKKLIYLDTKISFKL